MTTNKDSTWIITLEEDPETGDLVMPLPDDLLKEAGWEVGDELTWDVNVEEQTATLTKKTDK